MQANNENQASVVKGDAAWRKRESYRRRRERMGKRVYLVEGDEENLKITTPVDLILAEAILHDREERR